MNIQFPYEISAQGRTASAGDDEHIRGMIEQVLFTSPGERVNRPDFGCGLLRMVFEPVGPEIAAALQFTIQGALQRWLADLVDPRLVEVTSEDSTLRVTITYTVRRTAQRQRTTFVVDAASTVRSTV